MERVDDIFFKRRERRSRGYAEGCSTLCVITLCALVLSGENINAPKMLYI